MFDDQPGWGLLTRLPARAMAHLVERANIDRWRIQGMALGPICLVGTPADLGVSIALAAKEEARRLGFSHPFAASQCGGYIGYLHRREDYRKKPGKETLGMAIYENAMGFFGREMGEELLRGVGDLLAKLRP